MTFLTPVLGWLGLLALPVIAFYLLKTRQRRRTVSTLLFWSEIKPKIENSPLWRKLRRWVSLLLQLLVLGLIVAALARPTFDWERAAPRRIVAVLDPSASMQTTDAAPSRWERARDSLLTTIARMRVQDEMAVLTAENPPRIVSGWTTSQRALREAVGRTQPLGVGTDPRAALDLARELAKLRENGVVEVFSDAVWPVAPEPEPGVRSAASANPSNAGLTLFAARRSPGAAGDWQLDAEATASEAIEAELSLFRDGVPLDRVALSLQPGQTWRKAWRGSSSAAVTFRADLASVGADQLGIDNSATASVGPLRPVQVLVVGDEDPFLEAALSSIPLVEWYREPALPTNPPAGIDLMIHRGPTALAQPPSDSALLLINPESDGFWGKRAGSLADTPITEVDKASPLVRHAPLASVVIDNAGNWTPPAGADSFAASLGRPVLFGRWDRPPRWLVVGFDPDASDLPLRVAFPVLVANVIESLRRDSEGSTPALPGAVESQLVPLATSAPDTLSAPTMPVFPGWWLVLVVGLALLVGEWFLFTRRITD